MKNNDFNFLFIVTKNYKYQTDFNHWSINNMAAFKFQK